MAVFPVASGSPDLSGGFIPSPTFQKKLRKEFYKATVFGAIASTELVKDVKKFGDTARIRILPDISVRALVKDQDLVYENLQGTYVDLLVDKAQYWGLRFDDIDQAQTDIKDRPDQFAVHATKGMKVVVDADGLQGIYSSAHASNSGATAGADSANINLGATGSPLALTKTNVLEWIVDIGQVMHEQSRDPEMWKLVISPWIASLLKKSDLKDASLTGDGQSVLRNGRIGRIDNFELFVSRNLKTTTDTVVCTEVVACDPYAVAFVAQLDKTEGPFRLESKFGAAMRGMIVYGYKVVDSKGLVHSHVYKG